MAYPKLNSLTQNIADKILTLISYSETMTRDKYSLFHLASAQRRPPTPRNSAGLCDTTLRIFVGIATTSSITK
jgi:cystathionine beta-lyase/cystathionine gamma-synthase